jgi:hypothetical protein
MYLTLEKYTERGIERSTNEIYQLASSSSLRLLHSGQNDARVCWQASRGTNYSNDFTKGLE